MLGGGAVAVGYAGAAPGSGGGVSLPLFNVESYGALGDGTTDDYPAIRAAWDALCASATGGYLLFPRAAVYRVVADVPGRLVAGPGQQYALLPIPHRSSDDATTKRVIGIVGTGEAVVIRAWAGAGQSTAPLVTASVLQVDYSTPFAWSPSHGLPSVVGGRDVDQAGGFSNVHFVADHLVIRQEPDPSMCSLNLEAISTCHIRDLYCDVSGALDEAPEPTHPTGAAMLLPRTGNAVQVRVDRCGVWGMYTGCPVTEHSDVGSAIIVRCKIGLPIRRPAAHFAHLGTVSMEQCPWGIAGYDPSGAGPDGGIVAPAAGWVVTIDHLDVEDYDYEGDVDAAWMYPPNNGAHVYDPGNALRGCVRMARVDAGAAAGAQTSAYVTGATGLSLYRLSDPVVAVTRIAGGTPGAGGGGGAVADTFSRGNDPASLGTASSGPAWSTLTGTWGINNNRAYVSADTAGPGGGYNLAALDVGETTYTYEVVVTPRSGAIDLGPLVMVQDMDNLVFWDLSGNTSSGPTAITTRLFKRAAGTFSPLTNSATVTLTPSVPHTLRMVVGPTSIACHLDGVLIFTSSGATGLESVTRVGLCTAAGNADRTSTWDDLQIS